MEAGGETEAWKPDARNATGLQPGRGSPASGLSPAGRCCSSPRSQDHRQVGQAFQSESAEHPAQSTRGCGDMSMGAWPPTPPPPTLPQHGLCLAGPLAGGLTSQCLVCGSLEASRSLDDFVLKAKEEADSSHTALGASPAHSGFRLRTVLLPSSSPRLLGKGRAREGDTQGLAACVPQNRGLLRSRPG